SAVAPASAQEDPICAPAIVTHTPDGSSGEVDAVTITAQAVDLEAGPAWINVAWQVNEGATVTTISVIGTGGEVRNRTEPGRSGSATDVAELVFCGTLAPEDDPAPPQGDEEPDASAGPIGGDEGDAPQDGSTAPGTGDEDGAPAAGTGGEGGSTAPGTGGEDGAAIPPDDVDGEDTAPPDGDQDGAPSPPDDGGSQDTAVNPPPDAPEEGGGSPGADASAAPGGADGAGTDDDAADEATGTTEEPGGTAETDDDDLTTDAATDRGDGTASDGAEEPGAGDPAPSSGDPAAEDGAAGEPRAAEADDEAEVLGLQLTREDAPSDRPWPILLLMLLIGGGILALAVAVMLWQRRPVG
ncbi:MAG: hypothetical protein ACLFS9_10945, partial [Nitriliruptoraceae bacterium]